MYRRDNLRKVHGVTVDFYASLLKSQGGCCAICGAVPPNDTHLHIDHNHESGQIRGLLCSKCNTGIGLFDESSERMKAAMGYLALYARAEKAA